MGKVALHYLVLHPHRHLARVTEVYLWGISVPPGVRETYNMTAFDQFWESLPLNLTSNQIARLAWNRALNLAAQITDEHEGFTNRITDLLELRPEDDHSLS